MEMFFGKVRNGKHCAFIIVFSGVFIDSCVYWLIISDLFKLFW